MHWERGGSWRGHVAEVEHPCVPGLLSVLQNMLGSKKKQYLKMGNSFLESQNVQTNLIPITKTIFSPQNKISGTNHAMINLCHVRSQ